MRKALNMAYLLAEDKMHSIALFLKESAMYAPQATDEIMMNSFKKFPDEIENLIEENTYKPGMTYEDEDSFLSDLASNAKDFETFKLKENKELFDIAQQLYDFVFPAMNYLIAERHGHLAESVKQPAFSEISKEDVF